MTESNFSSYLINDRTSAFLHLIDACQFSDSELVDVYMGVCYRLKHFIDLSDASIFDALAKVKPSSKDDYQDDFV